MAKIEKQEAVPGEEAVPADPSLENVESSTQEAPPEDEQAPPAEAGEENKPDEPDEPAKPKGPQLSKVPDRVSESIPVDRTENQPLDWICQNPDCREKPTDRFFQFRSDQPRCPKCTSFGPPAVQLVALVHLLVPDPQGPIAGQYRRYYIACDPKREHIATVTNKEAGSDNLGAVNCPGCQLVAEKLRVKEPLGHPIDESYFGK